LVTGNSDFLLVSSVTSVGLSFLSVSIVLISRTPWVTSPPRLVEALLPMVDCGSALDKGLPETEVVDELGEEISSLIMTCSEIRWVISPNECTSFAFSSPQLFLSCASRRLPIRLLSRKYALAGVWWNLYSSNLVTSDDLQNVTSDAAFSSTYKFK